MIGSIPTNEKQDDWEISPVPGKIILHGVLDNLMPRLYLFLLLCFNYISFLSISFLSKFCMLPFISPCFLPLIMVEGASCSVLPSYFCRCVLCVCGSESMNKANEEGAVACEHIVKIKFCESMCVHICVNLSVFLRIIYLIVDMKVA